MKTILVLLALLALMFYMTHQDFEDDKEERMIFCKKIINVPIASWNPTTLRLEVNKCKEEMQQ